MKNKINNFINIIIGSSIGIFIGTSIFDYWHYKNNIDLYAMQSAPWYTSIKLAFILLLVVLGICIVTKAIIKKKFNK